MKLYAICLLLAFFFGAPLIISALPKEKLDAIAARRIEEEPSKRVDAVTCADEDKNTLHCPLCCFNLNMVVVETQSACTCASKKVLYGG